MAEFQRSILRKYLRIYVCHILLKGVKSFLQCLPEVWSIDVDLHIFFQATESDGTASGAISLKCIVHVKQSLGIGRCFRVFAVVEINVEPSLASLQEKLTRQPESGWSHSQIKNSFIHHFPYRLSPELRVT